MKLKLCTLLTGVQAVCFSLLSICAIAQDAYIYTDKTDYLPGDTVIVLGEGWRPGEEIKLEIVYSTVTIVDTVINTSADVYGNIYLKQFVIEQHHTGERFTLSATGMVSGSWAQTVFTDGANRWTGKVDNDWHKAGNWTGTQGVPTVPTAEDDVVIPAGAAITVLQLAYCKNLNMEYTTGSNVSTLIADASLQISGKVSLSKANITYGTKCVFRGHLSCDSLIIENSARGSNLTVEGVLAVLSGMRIAKPNNTDRTLPQKHILTVKGEIVVSGDVVSEGDLAFRSTQIVIDSNASLLIEGNYVSSAPFAETDMMNGSSLLIGGEWYIGNPYKFNHGTGTVIYNRNGDQTVGGNSYYNLVLSGSGSKSISTSSVRINNKLSMQGAATASDAPTYSSTANLEYKGDITQTPGAEWITTFQGEVIIDNVNGVLLNGNKVTRKLNLKNGVFKTNGYTLTVNFPGEGAIAGGSAASYVDGKLSTVFALSFSRTYPIGKDGVYRPLIISYTKIQNIVGGCTITAEQIEGPLPGEFPSDMALFTERHWAVSSGCPSAAFFYDISLDGAGFSLSDKPLVFKKDNSGIIYKEADLSGAVFTAKGFNSSGLFAIGEQASASSITVESPEAITYGAGSVTFNANVVRVGNITPINTGTVQFFLNDVSIGISETVTNGVASLAFDPSDLDAGNYKLMAVYNGDGTIKPSTSEPGKILVIERAPATIRLMDLEHAYDGHSKEVNVSTSPDGLTGVSISYKRGEAYVSSPVDAGSYAVEAYLANSNYRLVNDQGTDLLKQIGALAIRPRALIITVNDKNKVYGSDNPELDGTVSGLVSSDGINVYYATTALATSDVGEYPIIATIEDPNRKLDNYSITNTAANLTITPAPATITLSNTKQMYDGTPRFAMVNVIPEEAGANIKYFQLGREVAAPINAGQYEVEAVLANYNYEGVLVSGSLEIAKAPTTAAVAVSSVTYDGNHHGGTASVSGAAGLNQELNIRYSGTTKAGAPYSSNEAPTEAGEYIAVASFPENVNYLGSTDVQPFVIAPARATISVSDLSKVYNGSPQGAKITTTPHGLTVDVTYEGLYVLPINAGSYPVVAVLINSNFIATEGTGTLVIDKARQVIDFTHPGDKTYGDASFSVSAAASSGLEVGFSVVRGPVIINGSTITVIGAGEVVVRASQPGNGNYFSAADVDQAFKIEKAKAILSLGELSHVYDGREKAVSVTLSPGGLSGVSIAYQQGSVLMAAPINAGNYEVTVNLDHINYEAATATATLVISRAPTTTKVTVGDVVYDGQPHGGSAVVIGTANLGQELTVSYRGATKAGVVFSGHEPPTQAGDYTATASFTENDNYLGSSDSRSFVIHKAVPTITMNDVRDLFNGDPHAAVAIVNGVDKIIGDADVTYFYVGTPNGAPENSYTSSDAPARAGHYKVSASFAGNSNYNGADATADVRIFEIPKVSLSTPNPVAINNISSIKATLGDDVQNVKWFFTSDPNITTGNTMNSPELNIKSTSPNVYSVYVTFEDGLGKSGYVSDRVYAVFFDPSAGFVTGGGWISSLAGAYTPNIELAGKANFGFVSKFEKGKTVPTGNTEFQFQAGGMNFKSNEYEYLVVAGARAQFKGKGTINGTGNYGFMLSAVDENLQGSASPDKFRIKIWDNNDGKVVYDNQMGATEDVLPATAIGGGSIVIHTPGKKTNAIASDARTSEITEATKFSLKVFPNPSVSGFNVQVKSDNAAGKITLRILDLSGRTIEVIDKAFSGQTYNIGRTYRPGVYLVEMSQGSRRSQTMLLKVSE